MTRFACFLNGKFHRTVEAETMPDPNPAKGFEWYSIGLDQEGEPAGWRVVDGVALHFTAPPPDPSPRRIGTFREFMDLFTTEEQKAIASAAMGDVDVKLWYDRAMGGPSLDLESPDTAAGLSALVTAGLLTQARVDEIAGANFDAAG